MIMKTGILLKTICVSSMLGIFMLSLMLAGCDDQKEQPGLSKKQGAALLVGSDDSPLLGPAYAAYHKQLAANKTNQAWELKHFKSGGDIGYALLAGKLDAGFVETSKALRLLKAPGGEKLKIAGAIQFPYGATLVLRKDLKLRMSDLAGRTIAAQEPDCSLLHQFRKDARRHGVDATKIKFQYMPFDEMIPALEAKTVDGVLLKGSYAVLAENMGHKVLYQNWDVVAGDECCPASLAQTDYFLVVRDQDKTGLVKLITELVASNALPPLELRQSVQKQIGYPLEALEQFPLSSFVTITGDLVKEIGEQRCVLLR